MTKKPTVVLVHGALSDASIWAGVNSRLQENGFDVLAPGMPLRSLTGDIDYLASILSTIEGDVVLAGHSYGGTIISAPQFDLERVVGLVYVSAFAPDSGESTGELNGRWPGSTLNGDTTIVRPYPGGQDLYLKTDSFGSVYASDLPSNTVALMASAQRPIDVAALGHSFRGSPSWRSRPSFVLVSTNDSSLPPEAQLAMADRMGATVVKAASSHASPVSSPNEVFRLIEQAANKPE